MGWSSSLTDVLEVPDALALQPRHASATTTIVVVGVAPPTAQSGPWVVDFFFAFGPFPFLLIESAPAQPSLLR